MVPPRTVPHVTSDQRSFTPAIIATSGSPAESVAFAALGGRHEPQRTKCPPERARRARPRKIRERSLRAGCSVSAMPHPDVALERARLRFAQDCLEAMRRRTARPSRQRGRPRRERGRRRGGEVATAAAARVPRRRRRRAVLRPDRRGEPVTAGTSAAATSRTATARRWSSTGGPRSRRRSTGRRSPTRSGSHRRRRFVFSGRELQRHLRRGLRRSRLARGRLRRRARPAARRARPGAHRPDARHRRHDPGRAGRDHPRAARTLPRRAGRTRDGQDRGRPPPRRIPALRAPRAARRATACSSSDRTRCSSATSARCCRRSARRRRPRRRSTSCSSLRFRVASSRHRRGRRGEGRRAAWRR